MKVPPKTAVSWKLAGTVALSAMPAQAFQPTTERIGPANQIPAVELRVLEHEQRMLRAQQEHRLNLERDREALRYRSEQMRIPQVGRTCRVQLRGNKWLRTCS